MNIRKIYCFKIIISFFYLLLCSYSSFSYAIVEKCLQRDINNRECFMMGENDGIRVTSEVASEIKEIFKTHSIYGMYTIGVTYDSGVLSNLLPVLQTLTELHLHWSESIGDSEAKVFAKLLKKNTPLLSLQLPNCRITRVGIRAIAEALQINTRLKAIYLSGNFIRDEGALAIAQMLMVNNTLRSIDISYGGISLQGMLVIMNALIQNTTLQDINAHWYSKPEQQEELVKFILKRNQLIEPVSKKIRELAQKSNAILLSEIPPKSKVDLLLNKFCCKETAVDQGIAYQNLLDFIMRFTETQLENFNTEEIKLIMEIRGMQNEIVKRFDFIEAAASRS
jgi:Ran GTPase-activating protein (RanGAP) involved in mRNA processing and transport